MNKQRVSLISEYISLQLRPESLTPSGLSCLDFKAIGYTNQP